MEHTACLCSVRWFHCWTAAWLLLALFVNMKFAFYSYQWMKEQESMRENKREWRTGMCTKAFLPFSSCVYSLCACDIFYRYTSELRCWAAAAHPHILALLNVFQKMSRVINMMSVLSCAFIWGCVLETVALECSQTRPASPIKNSIAYCAFGEEDLNTEATLQIWHWI